MFRILTQNLNGIRSAARKGWLDWIATQDCDIVCAQELRVQEADLNESMRTIEERSSGARGGRGQSGPPRAPRAPLCGRFHLAQKKGYAGVGLYTREQPQRWVSGFGVPEFDDEGRYLEADFGHITVVSLYVPSGSASPERQASKDRFMACFALHLQALRDSGREIVICGDWNIAHRQIDLKNWKSNQKKSGFLPQERAWLDRVIDEFGFVDVFRRLDTREEQYTWWSQRGGARDRNVGWRIDYQFATPGLAERARTTRIHHVDRFSDHAALIVDYDIGA